MLKLLNYKSKKGISLAYALIVSLFLVMVTGGITTVAILQNNETGSDLNTRQAYISAKSGLDTMQDIIKNEAVIDPADYPSAVDTEKYYVLYQNTEDGNILYEAYDDEEQAKARVAELYAAGKIIVGGEGTYFKMEYDPTDGKIHVSALNVTGKYNNNVSLNRGDLSFDMIKVSSYEFKLDATTPSATTPSATTPSSTTPTTPTDPTIPTGTITVGGTGGDFLLVGQQSAMNELGTSYDGHGNALNYTLHSYAKDENQVYYLPSVEIDEQKTHTYFPVVYDRMVKVSSEDARCGVYAADQGVYMLGEYAGYKNVNEWVQAWNGDTRADVGFCSYVTQNDAYQQNIYCALLVVEHNFLTVTDRYNPKTPKLNYYGCQGKNYVYVYLPNKVTFYTADKDRPYDGRVINNFTMQAGYYYLISGSELCIESNWHSITDPNMLADAQKLNLYDEILSYTDEPGEEIHSGCNETGVNNPIQITNNNGSYNTDTNSVSTGFSTSSNYDYSRQDRSNMHIFFSPNMVVDYDGYYNWYAGRSFNFQWFRTYDLLVDDGCHIEMSAPTVVLTIGPKQYRADGTAVEVSNVVKNSGDGSWKLYGDRGTGSCKLKVMSKFKVEYDSGTKSYEIIEGEYTGLPEGLNLFSDEARDWFNSFDTTTSTASTADVSYNTSSSSSASLLPASIGNSNSFTTNPLSRFFSGLLPVPNRTVTLSDLTNADGTAKSVDQSFFTGDSTYTLENGVTNLYFLQYNSTKGVNEFKVNTAGMTIRKTLSDGTTYDYLKFQDVGTYDIPVDGSEDTAGVDLLADGLLKNRGQNWKPYGANFSLVTSKTEYIILKEYY